MQPEPAVAASLPAAEPVAAVVAPAPAPAAPEKAAAAAPETVVPPVPAATKKSPANNSNEVLKVIRDWAAAWSSKDVNRYLAFYAADFKMPGGEKRGDWEGQRRERISAPKSISVSIRDARVKFVDDNHASVTFRQVYRASHLRNTSGKTLVMVKSGGSWLIQEERSGK